MACAMELCLHWFQTGPVYGELCLVGLSSVDVFRSEECCLGLLSVHGLQGKRKQHKLLAQYAVSGPNLCIQKSSQNGESTASRVNQSAIDKSLKCISCLNLDEIQMSAAGSCAFSKQKKLLESEGFVFCLSFFWLVGFFCQKSY